MNNEASEGRDRPTPKSTNISWSAGKVGQEGRERLLGQRGSVLWFTGLSGSGKSTLAADLEARLTARGLHCYVLDGDNLRHGLNADLGFTAEDREENIRRMGHVAALFADAGLITLVTAISPFEKGRQAARKALASGAFLEIHLDVPVGVCQERDPKGLYQKVARGELRGFTGIDAPYEAPTAADLTLDTSHLTIEACSERILALMQARGFLDGQPQ